MAALSKAEYLKRYMSGPAVEPDVAKKKRRKKKVPGSVKPAKGLMIMDEDIDLSKVKFGYNLEEEEAPTVAEVIDERPDAIRQMEVFASNKKWKKMIADSGESTSNSQIHHHNSDNSPPRRARHDSDSSPDTRQGQDSDNSPPRSQRGQNDDSDNSPPRRRRHDSDQSPVRGRNEDKRKQHGSNKSPKNQTMDDSDQSPVRRERYDSDQSPPRRGQRKDSDSDQSPPRKRGNNSNMSKKGTHTNNSDGDLSPQRANKTLSGKAAGLSSAKAMKNEIEKLRLKEIEKFNKIGDDRLGKNAETVFRDKKTGKKRDRQSEKQADDAKQAEWQEKYDKWGAGLAQGKAEQDRVAEMVHEMSKPLARGKDDADRDSYLKDIDREGDPMLEFMKKKKDKKNKGPKYPQYKGPAPEPNRFGIRPGYRWDGVDRGNGFERKYFQSISKKKAVSSEAYKWSTEDM